MFKCSNDQMMNDKTKVIGTGLTGLVGSRVKELTADVFDWTNLSRSNGVNISDKKSLENAIIKDDSEVVIHFAAFTDLDEAEKQKNDKKALCYQINVEGTRNIASVCAKTGKHLIYVSTDAVFDGKENVLYTETDKPNPINWYGRTKWLGEQAVIDSGCKFTIIRIAYPFRTKFENKKDFVRKLLDKFSKGETLKMFSDTLFTPTYIDDISGALETIIQRKPSGIFHVVGSSTLSPFQAATEIVRVFGFNSKLIIPINLSVYLATSFRPYPRWSGLSNEKLKAGLDVSMRTFSEAILEMKRQLSFN